MRDDLERSIWLTENTKPFEEDPRTYGSYINDSVYSLLTQSTLPKEQNVTNAIARIKQIPRIVAVARQTIASPPKPILDTAILQNRGAISFYEKDIFDLIGPTDKLSELKVVTAEAVKVLSDYQTFRERGSRTCQRAMAFRQGALLSQTRTGADAGWMLSASWQKRNKNSNESQRDMYVVARQLWHKYYPGRPLPPDDASGRRSTIALVTQAVSPRTWRTRDAYPRCAQYRQCHTEVHQRKRHSAIARTGSLPGDRDARVSTWELARLFGQCPATRSARVSYYAVSPPPSVWGADKVRSFLEEYNKHMLQILTIHEAYPGHYVQLSTPTASPR